MIVSKKEFTSGVVLLGVFFVVLAIMFQPIFKGKNALAYLDSMYNSISKGSVNYIASLRGNVKDFGPKDVAIKLSYSSQEQAEQSEQLFGKAGVTVVRDGKVLEVKGSVQAILYSCLDDADLMYHNKSGELEGKYGIEARRTTYNWWTSLGLMEKAFNGQKEFKVAKLSTTVKKKAVETAYNYYEIVPMDITDELGVVIFSLIFYVVYTLWYGFAIMFVFEGWGLNLGH
ncbi:hypothetical protein [Maridesulfovibrio sp.]|uniref:hypothetical protein n=1 Tax=Maridesulfovibrio sp. TaxID=2795000 RepID=UPI002A18D88C|nr:hypothetical protein [Maridesulfovibrio sp.]